ncbi:ImmA/IrrE family metallo-endopeptidase [Kocuria sp. CPCC 204721]|uniref:ImmA/IrrE family metallo-endopeptidase n=1 Tax=Kocuria sp. CPCC 204721 TaxID=3073548 RepID=UPI0034D622E8
MRRGFKTESKQLALEVRAEIGLGPHDPFDPYHLAEMYGIRVVRLTDLNESDAVRHFTEVRVSALSGALIPDGSSLLILENDIHTPQRRRSTLSHEMAHVILEHSFGVTLAYDRKCGLGGDSENEADLLAGELLIPFDAALRQAWKDATNEEVATLFEVSTQHAAWRMNASGARKIVRRTRAARQRS